jgi:hypothetical protein
MVIYVSAVMDDEGRALFIYIYWITPVFVKIKAMVEIDPEAHV